MYTFQLDIGTDLTSPSIGGGWLTVNPVFNACTLPKGRGEDDLLCRKDLSGDLEFKGQEYEALKTLADAGNLYVDLRLYYDSDIILTGNLSLLGKWLIKKAGAYTGRLCWLGFVKDDLYNKIISNMGLEFPINPYNGFTDTIGQSFSTTLREQFQAKELSGSAVWQPSAYWTDEYFKESLSTDPDLWQTSTNYVIIPAEGINGAYPNRLFYGDVQHFVKEGSQLYVCVETHTSGDGTPGNTFADDLAAGKWVQTDPAGKYYSREEGDFEFEDSVWFGTETDAIFWVDQWVLANDTTGGKRVSIKCKKIFDVLESLLADIDPTIEIYAETSGSDTGFCEYTETNFPEKHYLFYYNFDEDPVLTLQNIIILYDTLFNCKWRLEGNIFVFRHPTERPSSVGVTTGYDLTAYKSNDWTVYQQETEIISEVNKESWKFADNVYEDWAKNSITYDNNYDTIEEKTLNYEVDIQRALGVAEGELLFAAEYTPSQWDLSNKVGLRDTANTLYNGELAVSRIVFDHHFEGRPFDSGVFSIDPLTTISLTRKRNILIKLNVPYFDPDIIDQENYLIQTNNGNLEVREINIKLSGELAEITAIK